MKKSILYLVIALSIMVVMLLPACSSDNDGSGVNEPLQPEEIARTETIITIIDGTFSKDFTIKYAKQAEIEAFYKNGKYLLGYFDAQDGGTKYFDSMGVSTVVWSENFPTTLYAQWGELSDLPIMELKFYTDGPYNGNPSETIEFVPEIANAVLGNLEGSILIKANFARYSTAGIGLRIRISDTYPYGSEIFFQKDYAGSDSYMDYNIEVTVDAECGRNGGIYFSGSDTGTNLMSSSYTKDMTLSIQFIP